jgi:hypothetical protein
VTSFGFRLAKRVASIVDEAALLLQQPSRSLPLNGAIAKGTKKAAGCVSCHSSPLALQYVLPRADPATCNVSCAFR